MKFGRSSEIPKLVAWTIGCALIVGATALGARIWFPTRALAKPPLSSGAGSYNNNTNSQNGNTDSFNSNSNNSTTNNYYQMRPETPVSRSIYFPKYALFWINKGSNIYDMGAVVKLTNLSHTSRLLNGIMFDYQSFNFSNKIGGGGVYIETIGFYIPHAQVIEDRELLSDRDGYYKIYFPARFEMTPLDPDNGPDFDIRGKWSVIIGRAQFPIKPEFSAMAPRILSENEWGRLNPEEAIRSLTFRPL